MSFPGRIPFGLTSYPHRVSRDGQRPGWVSQDTNSLFLDNNGVVTDPHQCAHLKVGASTEADVAEDFRFVDSGASKFSISFWMNDIGNATIGVVPHQRGQEKQYIIDATGNSTAGTPELGFAVYLSGSGTYNTVSRINNRVTFQVGSSLVHTNALTQHIVSDFGDIANTWRRWHHVVCTYDSSLVSNNQKIYLNGVLHSQGNCTSVLNITKRPYIGMKNTNYPNTYVYDVSGITGGDDEGSYFGRVTTTTNHIFRNPGASGLNLEGHPTVTIAGTTNWNDTYEGVTASRTGNEDTKFEIPIDAAISNELGLSGATATVNSLDPCHMRLLANIAIWTAPLSIDEIRFLRYMTRVNPLHHVNLNNIDSPTEHPTLSDTDKLFTWWTMGDYNNDKLDSRGGIVHNMSESTGVFARTPEDRDLYSTGENYNTNIDYYAGITSYSAGSSGQSYA